MFDANMKHLPKGWKFFADVCGVRGQLHTLGLNSGGIVQCHMLKQPDSKVSDKNNE